MAKSPLWKEAQELKEQYAKHGIGYSYNQRNGFVYLTVLNAPIVVIGVEGCQLTGHLKVYGGVKASRDIDTWVKKVKELYTESWKNNLEMMEFLENCSMKSRFQV